MRAKEDLEAVDALPPRRRRAASAPANRRYIGHDPGVECCWLQDEHLLLGAENLLLVLFQFARNVTLGVGRGSCIAYLTSRGTLSLWALRTSDIVAENVVVADLRATATGVAVARRSATTTFSATISEVRNAHKDKVPRMTIGYAKQTLANAERYITGELKEYEEKILGAEEKMLILEPAAFYAGIMAYISAVRWRRCCATPPRWQRIDCLQVLLRTHRLRTPLRASRAGRRQAHGHPSGPPSGDRDADARGGGATSPTT